MSDSGSIVFGWLTKLAVSLALLGLIVFDGLALLTTSFAVADHANVAAGIAADTYKETRSVDAACAAARIEAAKNDETLNNNECVVRPDTGRFTLTLHKTAVTLWMHRIGPLKRFTMLSGQGKGSPPL